MAKGVKEQDPTISAYMRFTLTWIGWEEMGKGISSQCQPKQSRSRYTYSRQNRS